MILRELEINDEMAFHKMREEWDGVVGFSLMHAFLDEISFESYLSILKNQQQYGDVPVTTLFAFEGDEIVGRISIRHRLSVDLAFNGQIGYGVLPRFRGNGYATEMLKGALEFCQSLGLEKVMISCNEDNLASARVIEKCGGIYHSTYDSKDGTSKKKRFWITLT